MTNRLHGAVYSDSFIISVPNAIEIDDKNVEIAYSVLTQSTQCAQAARFKALRCKYTDCPHCKGTKSMNHTACCCLQKPYKVSSIHHISS